MAVEKIIVGKDWKDLKTFGERGTAFIGKHIVGKGEDAHLTNPVLMDLTRPHVVLVCGKRGTGKSYSAGVIAEEIYKLPDDIRKNLAVIMIDTMGIYWSMKLPNEKENDILKSWGLKPEGINTKLFVPKGYINEYKETGITVDRPFTISVSELTAEDWATTFGFSMIDEHGILLEKVIEEVKEKYGDKFSLTDIRNAIEEDKTSEKRVKDALINRFVAAETWGLFEKEGTKIEEFLRSGAISIIDVSHYMRVSESWSIRAMVVGLLARKIFTQRLMARKAEEYGQITGQVKKGLPMVWLMMDEAHQFVPNEGVTAATEPLLTLIKEGREPGISVLLITQRPNKLHEDALSQADIIIAHRLTSKADIEALRSIMQTYMLEDIEEYINDLPKTKGSAILLDDNSERIYQIQMRPRFSWHAGGSPIIIKEKSLVGGEK
jgi:DNA helicase HerA-like ATPase